MSDSKTPQFDAAISLVLETLVPHTKSCIWKGVHPHCEGEFETTAEDIVFLKAFRVPTSKYCPTCRRMRRLTHMNMARLFKRICNAPGHSEQMISILTAECPFPVYDYEYFIGDTFDAFSFGTDYPEGGSPMETLFGLRKRFPMPSFLNRDPSSVNSEYSNGGRDNKNVYYAMGCYGAEDIWYTNLANKSKEIMDCRNVNKCDTLYDCVSCDFCYKCSFAYFSRECSDSMFIFDCRNSSDLFGCVNLRNKRYCIWNEQKTKEEYEAFMQSIQPLSYKKLREFEKKFWEFAKTLPMNASRNVATENVFGTMVERSRNMFDVTDSENSDNVRHADGALTHKDSMDFLFSGGSERVYQTINIGSQSSNVKFSISSKFTTESEFVFNSKNLSNCFMCFGLQNKSYCILNKQYTPEEYWPLVDRMKTAMLVKGEYGECPDMRFSAQAYNFSMAGIYYPLSKEQVKQLGGFWAEEPETNVGNTELVTSEHIPDTIAETTDDVLKKAVVCERTGRPFRIIASELAFYRKRGLPLPHLHPTVRMEDHFHFAPTGKKYKATCEKCGKHIESIFPKEKGFILHCETCFAQEYN